MCLFDIDEKLRDLEMGKNKSPQPYGNQVGIKALMNRKQYDDDRNQVLDNEKNGKIQSNLSLNLR